MRSQQQGRLRTAVVDDGEQLLRLWDLLFDSGDEFAEQPWRGPARAWFERLVGDVHTARFPVVEVAGVVVATAIGTLELGVPNPMSPRGRVVRLADVITLPEHRRHGHGSLCVGDVVDWARGIDADRVDLSATPEGQRIYEQAGFVPTSAPRMKLVLRSS